MTRTRAQANREIGEQAPEVTGICMMLRVLRAVGIDIGGDR